MQNNAKSIAHVGNLVLIATACSKGKLKEKASKAFNGVVVWIKVTLVAEVVLDIERSCTLIMQQVRYLEIVLYADLTGALHV